METIDKTFQIISGFVWGQYMLMLLVGTGVILTVVLRFINVRKLFLAIKLVFTPVKSEEAQGDISPFQVEYSVAVLV